MTERTTILIVDDESKIRRLLSRSLETEGFDVAVADSAMSASEFLKNGHCDLIILDYMMPEIDGMAGRTHQKLSNEPRYRSPFIGDLTRGTF